MDYKPGMAPPTSSPAPPTSTPAPPISTPAAPTLAPDSSSCPYTCVTQQGELVRKLKAEKAPKVPGYLCSPWSCSQLGHVSALRIPYLCPVASLSCPFGDAALSDLSRFLFPLHRMLFTVHPKQFVQSLVVSTFHLHASRVYPILLDTIIMLMVPGPD